jgi:GDP-L-fucose synthase
MNFNGKIVFDKSKPDGTMKKVVDVQIANSYGWKSKISLSKGFDLTYKDFLEKFERH